MTPRRTPRILGRPRGSRPVAGPMLLTQKPLTQWRDELKARRTERQDTDLPRGGTRLP